MIPRKIVHASHHKAGTVWFKRVLRGVADHYGAEFAIMRPGQSLPPSDIVLDENAWTGGVLPKDYIGSHMVRDPRDMVVSAYFYHLKCSEAWVLEPRQEYGGKSLQEHLNSVPQDEGLSLQIELSSRSTFEHMRTWDYGNPNILELRYEDCIGRDKETFEKVFRFYGFSEDMIAKGVEIAKSHSLENLTGRKPGEEVSDLPLLGRLKAKAAQTLRGWTTVHIRSGKPGQWKEAFSRAHKARAEELFGDLIEELGYGPTR